MDGKMIIIGNKYMFLKIIIVSYLISIVLFSCNTSNKSVVEMDSIIPNMDIIISSFNTPMVSKGNFQIAFIVNGGPRGLPACCDFYYKKANELSFKKINNINNFTYCDEDSINAFYIETSYNKLEKVLDYMYFSIFSELKNTTGRYGLDKNKIYRSPIVYIESKSNCNSLRIKLLMKGSGKIYVNERHYFFE